MVLKLTIKEARMYLMMRELFCQKATVVQSFLGDGCGVEDAKLEHGFKEREADVDDGVAVIEEGVGMRAADITFCKFDCVLFL